MTTHVFPKNRPPIIVSALEYRRLSGLAEVTRLTSPEVADELEAVMDRAQVVSAALIPADVAQMGSTVSYQTDGGPTREVTLVYPRDADIESSRISVLTPIGAALIGMSIGKTIDFKENGERDHVLTVLRVQQPAEPYIPS